MKNVWILYIKSSEIELSISFLDENEAQRNAVKWGKYVTIHKVQIEIKD